jgi:hypothetical protein
MDTFPRPNWIHWSNLFHAHEYTPEMTLLYSLAQLDEAHLLEAHPDLLLCFKSRERALRAPADRMHRDRK